MRASYLIHSPIKTFFSSNVIDIPASTEMTLNAPEKDLKSLVNFENVSKMSLFKLTLQW